MGIDLGLEWSWDGGAAERAAEEAARGFRWEVAEWIAARARELCPVKTGALKRSIRVVAGPTGDPEVLVAEDYAAAVEFGADGEPPAAFVRRAVAEARAKFGIR